MSLTDVRLLRAFTLVLDLGSVSAAAEVLGYTQSAVSQQLAALERQAGAVLVDRSRRPFAPTPAGAALRPHADRVLAVIAGAEAAISAASGRTRVLRLAAFPSALAGFLATAVRELRRDDPEIVVRVLQAETREAVGHVRDGAADLAVVHHLPWAATPEMPGLDRHRLLTDELRVVLPERHRLAGMSAIALGELEDEPLLVPRRDTPEGAFRAAVEHLCARAGFTPRVAYEVDDLTAAQAFAAAGIAVVLMHDLTVSARVPGIAVRPLADPSLGSRAVEAVLPGGPRDPAVGRFLEHVVAAARARAAAA